MSNTDNILQHTVNSPLIPDNGSFRDRNNRVYDNGAHIVRGLSKEAEAIWLKLSEEALFQEFQNEAKVVHTETMENDKADFQVDENGGWPAYLVHERIPYVSYPYEWSFSMLKDAALLHLELVERSISAGWTMKDATAYNIQWVGCRPVFIDIPSFEPYVAGSPWIGYRQFCMMFLYPLMMQAYKGVDFQPLLRSNLEGIEVDHANRLLSGTTKLRKGVLSHVYLHAKMQSRYSGADLDEAKALTEDSEKKVVKQKQIHHSEAMVLGTIQGLGRVVKSLKLDYSRTVWGDYDSDHSYGETSFEAKKSFIEQAVSARPRQLVWDLGCNTGTFSRICAKHSDYVIAVDGDTKAIDRLYQNLKTGEEKNILPLIMNLGNISPGQGWRGRERKAFDHRGKPDLVLCLALIHHIVITANIPLEEFIAWLRELDAEIVIEFVSVEDDMSKMLLRNRVNQYSELTEARFEEMVSPIFEIKASRPLKGSHRKLYHLAPRNQ